ncbi:MAG: TOBE domain-containing protein [Armatimonadetes bacterium]|nr:TOBE domain-containing protein [Armatimonadota bacterium]
MNRLRGKIVKIESTGLMSSVDVKVGEDVFSAFVLETPPTCGYLREGGEVSLLFKETEVSLAREFTGIISIGNQMEGTVSRIDLGKILGLVELDYRGTTVGAITSKSAVTALDLKKGDKVRWLLKSSELSLMEV